MIDIEYRRATLISAIVGILVVIIVYTIFASVDLVFMKGDEEIGYKANVSVFSSLDDIEDENEYTYTSGDVKKDFNADLGFRLEIAKTTIVNLFTFNWSDDANVIVLQAK